MKRYNFLWIVFLTLFFFSCDKKTENMSRSTYYVAFEIKGANPVIMQVGDEYVDAGAIATLQGKDVTGTMITKSNVVDSEMGLYKVEYSAVNADGLVSRAVRDVIVCNPDVTADISGTWDVSDETYRYYDPTGVETPYGGEGFTVKITYIAAGFFSVSDFFAGYYSVFRYPGNGTVYDMTGYLGLNEDNTINVLSSHVTAWGDGLDVIENGIYDPDSDPDFEILKWDAIYSDGDIVFHVKLTKKKE